MATAFEDAWNVQQSASSLGFDWPTVEGVLDKLTEEVAEIRESIAGRDRQGAQREVGDLLLATVNACRFLRIDPALALSDATARFSKRFARLESMLHEDGQTIESCSFDELNVLWERAKLHGG